MATEKVTSKDMTEFEGPIDTSDAHGKRPADRRKKGDIEPDESVGKSGTKGATLPGTTTVGEEIESLFSGVEGLSEDFVERASTIVEGAISEKVALIREEMEDEYNAKLEEAYSSISEDLETKLDEYLNLFVEEYMKENEVAIERGFRQEIAEDVISALKNIVEAAGLDLPEDKIDIADALVQENSELESKYNETLLENMELKKSLRQYEINEAFVANTDGLTEAAKDKLRRLTENLEFSSVDQFVKKLEVLKESVSTPAAVEAGKKDLTEASDLKETVAKEIDPKMQRYIEASRGSYLQL